jgi:hypothetical protein
VLQARERAPIPDSSAIFTLDSHLSLFKSLGAHQNNKMTMMELEQQTQGNSDKLTIK